MSFFSRLLCCCMPQQNDNNLPPSSKKLKRILPDSNVILSVPKEQQSMLERATLNRNDLNINSDQQSPESLIFCYGLLSSYLHLQRLPNSLSRQNRMITSIIVGEAHCIMMVTDGQLLGLGSNEYGQLGFSTDPRNPEEYTQFVENITLLRIQGLNLNDRRNRDVIEQMTAGKNHNVFLVRNLATGQRKIVSFGLENGIGVDGQTTTHIPVEIVIPKLMKNNEELKFLYSRYNTNVAVDKKHRIFMWGEDSNNLRLRKPKLFYQFRSPVKQIALGKRHGIVLTEGELGVYGWGDGTYGELGIQENLPIEAPVNIPFFANMQIDQIAAGARHTLALDYYGNIYAMGDNSEDQCAISGRRANQPEKISKDFKVTQVYAGDSHNITVSHDKNLYSWGGSMINSSWINSNSNESKLRLMEDLKRRNITLIDLSYSNTIIITGQQS